MSSTFEELPLTLILTLSKSSGLSKGKEEIQKFSESRKFDLRLILTQKARNCYRRAKTLKDSK